VPLLPTSQPGATPQGSFLPSDYIARKAATRNNIITIALFVLVMGATVGAFVVTHIQWRMLKARYDEVTASCEAEKKKLAQLDTLRAQRGDMMEKAQITAALVERVPRWAILSEVDFRMPLSMRIHDFTMKGSRTDGIAKVTVNSKIKDVTKGGKKGDPKKADAKKTGAKAKEEVAEEKPKIVPPKFAYALVIAGTAEQNAEITDYLARLKESPCLSSVELSYIKDQKFDDQILRSFEITADVKSDVDQVTLASSLQNLVVQRTAMFTERSEQHTEAPASEDEKVSAAPEGDEKGGN
jgi:Tfp pilus assembly protein PilN